MYTNENCIGCNKCISACSCVGACVAVADENGNNRIEVSGDKCVACGACFDVCEHGVSGPLSTDEIEYGLGSIYPMPGGLKENVYWFLGEDAFIRQIEGEKHMYHYLEREKERIAKGATPYLFIDALNCGNGCICGTATEEELSNTDTALEALLQIKIDSKNNKHKHTWSRKLTPAQRLAQLNRQFKNLKLEDYVRTYTDQILSSTEHVKNELNHLTE